MTLLETQYFPAITWCAALWPEKSVALDAAEHYQKGGLRNRCYLIGPNGIQRLSIPLEKGKHQQTPIRDVRISNSEPWQRQHWRSIQAAYGNAPFYAHYESALRPFFEKKWPFLYDLNLEIIDFVLNKTFRWSGEIHPETSYTPPGDWPKGLDGRNQVLEIEAAPYAQVFEDRHGFVPNLSVLDLLFCTGKLGGEVLARTKIIPN